MKPSQETLNKHVMHYDAMRVKHIYNEIDWLTEQIAESNLGMELVEAAKTGNEMNVKKVLATFEAEYIPLIMQIKELSEYHMSIGDPHIFAAKNEEYDGEMLFKYDPEKIDIFNLFIFFWIAEIDPSDVFEDDDIAIEVLRQNGHPKMASYIEKFGTEDIVKDFIKIFANNNN